MKPPKKNDPRRILLHGQPVVPPPALDFEAMSWPELILRVRGAYQYLQQVWAAELQKPQPDWEVLEKTAQLLHKLERYGEWVR